MKERNLDIIINEYAYDELPEEDRRLVDKAKEMTRNSYAPFSGFHVGAALLLDNGMLVGGANQENAAFSSGTCAERSACFYVGANYPEAKIKKIAVAAWTRNGHPEGDSFEDCFQAAPISPCGHCRQALLEYEKLHGPIEVILYGKDTVFSLPSVASLLPLCFTEF